MTGVLVLLLSAASGWLGVAASGTCRGLRPRWAAVLLEATFGVAAGLGSVSALFFALLWAGLDARPAAWSALFLPATASALLFFLRKPVPSSDLPTPPDWRWSRLCAAAFVLALAFFLAGFASVAEANPQGDWDAWTIWNLRARYLAAPAAWPNAVSPDLTRTHPHYPLLWSGVIGHAWAAGSDSGHPAVPLATAVIVSAAAPPLLLAAALAVLHSPAAGWPAALILVSAATWRRQSQALYADAPLAFFLLAALAAALAQARNWHRPALALSGLLAALAAWTKNEGLLFFVFCALGVCRR